MTRYSVWLSLLLAAGAARGEEAAIIRSAVAPYPAAGRVLRIAYASPLLKGERQALVYLPPGYDAPANRGRRYPVIYYLHGCPGSIRDWIERGNAHRTMEGLMGRGVLPPVIAVFPGADGPRGHYDCTAYLDRADGRFPMESSLTRELVPLIDRTYRTAPDAAHRALIGLSEGGYAAVNLAVRHPDLFAVAASHSGYFRAQDDEATSQRMLGTSGALWLQNSPLDRVGELRQPQALHIYLGVGEHDDLREEAVRFSERLARLGIDHELHVVPGKHAWTLWAHQLRDSLVFVGKAFR